MAKVSWLAQKTDRRLVKMLLPIRARNTHKGNYGRVLLLCGSVGLSGAAILSAKAASRMGSGLVYLGVPQEIYPIAAAACHSQIVFPLPSENGALCEASFPEIEKRLPGMDAVLLGPGLGRAPQTVCLVRKLLSVIRVPLVLDADGINAFEGNIDILRGSSCPIVLTPHDGEFSRLGGDANAQDRIAEAMRMADALSAVVLRKGFRTVVTDGCNTYLNETGNPGLACGGSGDVLSGMIVSLLGQHILPLEAAAASAYIHGKAADVCAERLGEYGMIPEDLLTEIPRLLK